MIRAAGNQVLAYSRFKYKLNPASIILRGPIGLKNWRDSGISGNYRLIQPFLSIMNTNQQFRLGRVLTIALILHYLVSYDRTWAMLRNKKYDGFAKHS
jgi:hypothetical protein